MPSLFQNVVDRSSILIQAYNSTTVRELQLRGCDTFAVCEQLKLMNSPQTSLTGVDPPYHKLNSHSLVLRRASTGGEPVLSQRNRAVLSILDY